jgi:tripartite-type tricarboxylate transporter receptor subunit TctC
MRPQEYRSKLPGQILVGLLAWLLLIPSHLFSQAPFYQGKTITIIQGRDPGGLGDLRVRAVMPFLHKHIPGNPNIVTEFMPGGGGRKLANHIYRSVRPDGLTVANVGAGFVSNAILGEPGVQYDVDKIIYLGSGNSKTSYVFATRREVGLDSMEKLLGATGVRIGAQSVGHDIYINGRLFAWLLGLKDAKFVTGYSGPEVDIAMMRGEVDARANVSDTVVKRNPDWIEKALVHFHAIIEIPKGFRNPHPVFARLPELEAFTKSDAERKVLAMFRIFRLVGSPYILPPNTPKELAEILKEAFRKVFKDPDSPKTFRGFTGEDPNPLTPEEQEKAVKDIPRDREIIQLFNRVAGGDPLPPR